MSSTSGMNRLTCSKQGKQEIRSGPPVAVETYPFYQGSGITGRDQDIATSQGPFNAIILYYTPKNDTIETIHPPSERPSSVSTQPEQQQPQTPHELEEGEDGSRGWSTSLGLPAQPEVIMCGSRGIDAEAFTQLCLGIARRSPVLEFQEWVGDEQDAEVIRTENFSYLWLMNNISGKAMGGRSCGARCATKASIYSSNKNLILWSFPLMNPDIILGPLRRQMKARSWCIYVQDMDHDFNCETQLQEQKICNAIGTIAGMWLNGDPEDNNSPWNPDDGTEMGMAWDAEREEVVWTEWRRPGAEPPVADTVRPDIAGAL